NYFGDADSVLGATEKQLLAVEGINQAIARNIVQRKESENEIRNQLSRMNKANARIVTFWDKDYPENLKKIYDPPVFLFVRGSLATEDKYSIAVVGTRNPSVYGKHVAEKISAQLAENGIPVISGLARGIDTVVHSVTVRSGGRTVAVLGSGVDVIYPSENRKLSEQILLTGAVISEYLMGAKPDSVNFPRRNRIISGMAIGTVVVETDVSGGAMITASLALDQNREVFAVPGNITEKKSRGTNMLIKEGRAKLIDDISDIVEELGNRIRPLIKNAEKAQQRIELTLFEHKILEILTDEPQHIDVLAERSRMTTSDLLVQLLGLELKGVVKQLPGKYFVKRF
ncbi:MAG: DNA-processing protein DprA, partial [Candidatus Kryptoniota bacterium]